MRNFILILICFLSYDISAQTSGKHKGRDIKISDDGTWRYADELECDFNGKRIIINADGTWEFADDKPNKTKSNKTKTNSNTKDKKNDKTSTANNSKTDKKEDVKDEVVEAEPEPVEEKGYSDNDNGETTSKLLTVIDRVDYSGGFGFTVKRMDEKVYWMITCTGRDKCTVKGTPIEVVFTDGTKMNFTNSEVDNCNYLTAADMNLKNERDYKKYAQLSTVGIKTMMVKTKNSEVNFPFSETQAKKVMGLFKSVYEVKM